MSPVPFSHSQQRREQEKLTPERILLLAKRPDGFSVSWRYRDEWLHKRCLKMKKQGLLRFKHGRGETVYFARPQPASTPSQPERADHE